MLMSWVYLGTNRSILSAFMMHLAGNFTGNLFQPSVARLDVLRMGVVLALGVALRIIAERQRWGMSVPDTQPAI